MLTSAKKSFFRSGRGKQVTAAKQTQKVYLRSDIPCGSAACAGCKLLHERSPGGAVLAADAECYIIPDTNVFLHNIDAIESPLVKNVVVLDTVLQECRNLNRGVYQRIAALVKDARRKFYVFANENHKDTAQPDQEAGESANDRNDKAIRAAAKWYHVHLSMCSSAPKVFLVTHDRANRETAEGVGISCYGMAEYVSAYHSDAKDLLEKVSSATGPTGDRKPGDAIFPPWDSDREIQSGLTAGKYVRATLRQQGTNIFEGWASTTDPADPKKFVEYLLPSRAAVNRTIHGDVVAVEVLPCSKWCKPSRVIRQQGGDVQSLREATSGTDDEQEARKMGFVPTGRVVGLIENNRRPLCGTIIWDADAEATGLEKVLFQPVKGNFPRIRLATRQVEKLRNKRVQAVIDEWTVTSAYPDGHYVKVLGDVGDKDVEAQVILLENDVPHYSFSKEVLNCLPKGVWRVTPEEEAVRTDFRDRDVVSVDPPGCMDIDDALHCKVLPNGNYEVGVHIADVTHFMKEGTPLDEEAQKRSTSVYLVDRRIDMLPKLLTENLCSLVGGEDRYTFSVLWEFTPTGEKVNVNFMKGIIRSRAALTYYKAQDMVDDPKSDTPITKSLKALMRLSRIFRRNRIEAGALTLASQEMRFEIDRENVGSNPTDVQEYVHIPTMSMVEEWMLAANCAVAEFCYKTFPKWACLRRHPSPADGAFDELNDALKAQGMPELRALSSKSLAESLDRCNDKNDPYFNKLVRILTTRNMQQAKYFSSGDFARDEYHHYGLAMPIYTHFTSPIRRFADDVVHRQLAAALGIDKRSDQHMDPDRMKELTSNMNYRHTLAQHAGRDSRNLYTGFYFDQFRDGTKEIEEQDAYVVRVLENGVVIMVPRWAVENPVYFEDCPQFKGALRLLDKVRIKVALLEGAQGDAARNKLKYTILAKESVKREVEPLAPEFGAAKRTSSAAAGAPKKRIRVTRTIVKRKAAATAPATQPAAPAAAAQAAAAPAQPAAAAAVEPAAKRPRPAPKAASPPAAAEDDDGDSEIDL